MNFGALQIATLWRVEKDGIVRQAIVVDSDRGPRLVIIEADRIVSWERFPAAGPLRARAVDVRSEHYKDGWKPAATASESATTTAAVQAELRKLDE